MKNTALSTACFFPEHPEDSFKRVAPLGFDTAEVFVNTDGETTKEYFADLKKQSDESGVKIIAIHSPYGYAEPVLFFSPYTRRTEEALDRYERFFENIAVFAPVIFNFHGGYLTSSTVSQGVEIYARLSERAKKYGVVFCQENVNKYVFSAPENVKELKRQIPDCNFTIDIKQAHRAGFSPFDVAAAMGGNIRHFHINDFDESCDCLLPGKGGFDLRGFCRALEKQGFSGRAVIEVYRKSFGGEEDIIAARKYLEALKW